MQRYIQISLEIKDLKKDIEDEEDEDSEQFDDVKRICKELLFNGADRSMMGRFNLSLLDSEMTSEYQMMTPL